MKRKMPLNAMKRRPELKTAPKFSQLFFNRHKKCFIFIKKPLKEKLFFKIHD